MVYINTIYITHFNTIHYRHLAREDENWVSRLRINIDALIRISITSNVTFEVCNVFVLPFEVYQRHGLKLTVGFMRVMKFWWDSTRRNQSTFCGLLDRSAGNSLSAIFELDVSKCQTWHTFRGSFINPFLSRSCRLNIYRNGENRQNVEWINERIIKER